MTTAWRSLAFVALIPLLAFALEPSNPNTFCTRFVGDQDVQTCEERMDKEEADWYAATICNLQQDDGAFWKCWDQIKGRSYSLKALEACSANSDFSDDQRLSCVKNAEQSQRQPASVGGELFQPLKTKKKSTPTK